MSLLQSKGGGMHRCPPYLVIFGLNCFPYILIFYPTNLSSIHPILPFIFATFLEMLTRTSMLFSELSPIGLVLDMIPTKLKK